MFLRVCWRRLRCSIHVPKYMYSKTCCKRALKNTQKVGFEDQLSLNAGQKYCRMLQGELSAILSTCIKLPLVIQIFVLSIFEWPFKTGLTVKCAGPFRVFHISTPSMDVNEDSA